MALKGAVGAPDSPWTDQRSPSLADIEALARAAFAQLPDSFRRHCAGLVFHVVDFPDDETQDEMGCDSPFDLLGLFRGIGLA